MEKSLTILFALAAGVCLSFQVGFNSTLKERIGHPIHAALISFATGTVGLALMAWFVRGQFAAPSQAARGPWWMWLGGLTGVVYVVSSAALAVRLGSAGWLALVIAGQVVASLVLDHYGLVGFAVRPVSALRLTGAVLLLVGVYLVLKS